MIRWIIAGTCGTLMLAGMATAVSGVDVVPAAGLAPASRQGFLAPLDHATVTQGFGCTALILEPLEPSCASGHWHSGLDLAAPPGTPVRAVAAGVAAVTRAAGGYGLHVIVRHAQGVTSLYGHLSSVAVSSGEPVEAGAVIGAVGSTGNSTGPHLHLEIRRNGTPEDPANDIPLP